jgi:lysyl-tRNA synthetase, class II
MRISPIHVERHELGPRLFVFGRRVHEWTVGAALVATLGALLATDVLALGEATVALLGLGLWLFVKDRHDLLPSRRDRCAWSWGSHRRPGGGRPQPRGDWLPPVAAGFAALTALINLDSALVPNIHWRGQVLADLVPDSLQPWSHALALPLSGALLLAAVFLAKRRYRAWQGAIGLLVLLGALNLLKGLAFEEALLSWAAAGVLVWGRPAFAVAPAPEGLRSSARLALGVIVGTLTISTLATMISMPGTPRLSVVLRETADLLLWQAGPVTFAHQLSLFPLAIGLVSWGGLLAALWVLCRPLGAPRTWPGLEAWQQAHDLVRAHGPNALADFALHADTQYLFGSDGRAFLGYRARHGVLLVSSDPVGEPDAVRGLLGETLGFASRRGLRVAVLAAGAPTLPVYRDLGMRTLCFGEEAVLDTATFDLDGRRMHSVRESVAQLERAGYRASLFTGHALDQVLVAELQEVARRGAAGEPGQGSATAGGSLRRLMTPDALVVVARHEDGTLGAFLHFVPVLGRSAVSLASMFRRPDAPDGLLDYLVARSTGLLGERGVAHISFNSAARASFLREQGRVTDHLAARLVCRAGRRYRFERLSRFNAKFHPRWEPRYLVYENRRSLARTTVAALSAKDRLPRMARSHHVAGQDLPGVAAHNVAVGTFGGEE